MDERASMQSTEALLDSLCVEDILDSDALPQDGQVFDIFALDLGEDLALHDVDSAMGCSVQQQGNVPAPQPAAQRKNDAHRVERIRTQNREAQARYRQKAKVHSSGLLCMCCVSPVFIALCKARDLAFKAHVYVLLHDRCAF